MRFLIVNAGYPQRAEAAFFCAETKKKNTYITLALKGNISNSTKTLINLWEKEKEGTWSILKSPQHVNLTATLRLVLNIGKTAAVLCSHNTLHCVCKLINNNPCTVSMDG